MIAFEVLTDARFQVLEAEDGQDALRVLQSDGIELHVLLTDVNLPRIDGRELARQHTFFGLELEFW